MKKQSKGLEKMEAKLIQFTNTNTKQKNKFGYCRLQNSSITYKRSVGFTFYILSLSEVWTFY